MNTNIKNTKKWSLALATAVAVGSVAPSAQAAKLFALSEQDEIKAGQEVARQAERQYGRALPASNSMARRVNAIGRRLVGIAERRNIPYTYTVLQNDKVLNAFAAPGGPIFVTTKLVQTTANDAELAYVLGHETAHIERRHIAKSVEKQQKVGLGVGILGAILGRRGGSNVLGTIAGVAYKAWESGYSRDQEDDADAVGVRMMARLGYDPRAAATMLAKLEEGGGSRGGLDKYLASHPAPAARIKKVNAQIQKESLVDIARRSGGPRLSDNGNYGSNYGNGGYADANDTYGDDSLPGGNTNANGNDYPDYNNGGANSGGYADDRVADLGGPLRVVENGDQSVILASAAGVARWAGGRVSANGNVVTLTRGNRTMQLRRYSTVATVNGRQRELSVAPNIYDGMLYAPLGDLVEGVGGRARYDQANNAIRLTLDGRESVISLRQ